MKPALLLLAAFLLALPLPAQTSQQLTPDPGLLTEINQIKAIDNHSHPPALVNPGEKDDDYDALPCDPLEATAPGLMCLPTSSRARAAIRDTRRVDLRAQGVAVVQPEVRRAVDDGRAAGEPPGRVRRSHGVRQSCHHDVDRTGIDAVLDDQLDGTSWNGVAVPLAGAPAPEHARELHMRMAGEQRRALHADVAGGADDGGAKGCRLGHDRAVYGHACILMQSRR